MSIEVVRGRYRGPAWRSVTYGVHVTADASTVDELLAWQQLLPTHGGFTHLTGAAVRGWWLPPIPAAMPVFGSIGQRDPRPLREGIRTVRLKNPSAVETVGDVRVASAFEILIACARDLGLLDMVVLLDGAATAGDVDLAELRRDPLLLRRRAGLPALRRALELADPRSESAWETLLRLLHVVCGVEVEPQFEVPELGARADLLIVGTRTFHEYDGEVHLPRTQQRKDLRRHRRLDVDAWSRHGYTSDDVLHRAVTILRDADHATGRPHEPERVRVWHDLLRESLFTPAGTSRFLRRLGLE